MFEIPYVLETVQRWSDPGNNTAWRRRKFVARLESCEQVELRVEDIPLIANLVQIHECEMFWSCLQPWEQMTDLGWLRAGRTATTSIKAESEQGTIICTLCSWFWFHAIAKCPADNETIILPNLFSRFQFVFQYHPSPLDLMTTTKTKLKSQLFHYRHVKIEQASVTEYTIYMYIFGQSTGNWAMHE